LPSATPKTVPNPRAEHERGVAGRFAPGLPRISDGQLLFLLHMLAHAKPDLNSALEKVE
jgi:hypothetical protein